MMKYAERILLSIIVVLIMAILGIILFSPASNTFELSVNKYIALVIALAVLFLMVFLFFYIGAEKRSFVKEYLSAYQEKKIMDSIEKHTQELSSSLDKRKVLRLILTTCKGILDFEMAFLLIYDYARDNFRYESGYDFDYTMLADTGSASFEKIIRVLSVKKEIIEIDNIKEIEEAGQGFMLSDKASHLRLSNTFLAIPLVLEKRLTGIVGLYCSEKTVEIVRNFPAPLNIIKNDLSMALAIAIQSEYAILDRLTLLYNHEHFMHRLGQEISRCKRYKLNNSLLMIDIDHFKSINDTHGHPVGDVILKKVAQIIKSKVRITDLCARYGGEEFAVLLAETSIQGAVAAENQIEEKISSRLAGRAEQIRKAIEEHKFEVNELQLHVTVSIGISHWEHDKDFNKGGEELIKQSDEQLYRAKNTGRNKVCYLVSQ